MAGFDPSLYLVTDPDLVPASGLVDAVRAAVAGGVTLVQLRDKEASGRQLVESARAIVEVLRPLGVPLIVNDRADVAVAAGADGVHVGQSDLTVADARKIVGPDAIVGLSIETVNQAGAVDEVLAASYVAVSPVYGTPTKPDHGTPLGLEGLADVSRRCTVPVLGIGGIDVGRARAVIRAGAAGVAVVSAILARPDIKEAARALREAVDNARQEPLA